MANIDAAKNTNGRRNKADKQFLRIDFTPMVDMNMLLITFFMFCTTLSLPQVMDIAMPANTENERDPQPASRSMTVILGDQDKIYYYTGLPNYDDYTSLKETDGLGLRKVLLERNITNVSKIGELKQQWYEKKLTDDEYKKQINEVKKSRDGLIVLIKPTQASNYANLVDVLDEMQICGIGKYAVVDVEEADNFLLDNLNSKGELMASISN